jgi:hypothetical protein
MASRLAIKQYAIMKRPRVKKQSHLDFIRSLPCAVCGQPDATDAAHVRMASLRYAKQMSGMGAKPDDSWTVPLCRHHHRVQHDGNEGQFWSWYQKDPFVLALALWKHSGDYEAGLTVLKNAR